MALRRVATSCWLPMTPAKKLSRLRREVRELHLSLMRAFWPVGRGRKKVHTLQNKRLVSDVSCDAVHSRRRVKHGKKITEDVIDTFETEDYTERRKARQTTDSAANCM